MKKSLSFPVLSLITFVLGFCSGCISNDFNRFYTRTESPFLQQYPSLSGRGPVSIRPVSSESDVLSAMEEGYVPVGSSAFTGRYCPWACAIDQAEAVGADLVLVDCKFKTTKAYTSVVFLPSTQVSHTYGTVNATTYGPSGSAMAMGSYSGTTTSSSMNAIPVVRETDIYDQAALFFKRVNLKNYYGAVLCIPRQLPTEKSDTPCVVTVLVVIKGSQAEKEGIRKGQIVRSINATPIKVRNDVVPYLKMLSSITHIEVDNEQK